MGPCMFLSTCESVSLGECELCGIVYVFMCVSCVRVCGVHVNGQREGKEPATVVRRVRTGIGNKALALLCSPFHLAHLPSVSYGQKLTKRQLSRESEKCM